MITGARPSYRLGLFNAGPTSYLTSSEMQANSFSLHCIQPIIFFSHQTNTSQQYFSLTTNQHQPQHSERSVYISAMTTISCLQGTETKRLRFYFFKKTSVGMDETKFIYKQLRFNHQSSYEILWQTKFLPGTVDKWGIPNM